ncbi:MAG: YihY/virulence factor BrkB family protein [Gemmatimonadota bacterium]
MNPKVFLQLLWKAIEKWFSDSASRHGAAIAYYTLFALAPVLMVVIAIAGSVFGDEAVRGQIVNEIAALIGRDGAEAVQTLLRRASEPRDGMAASIIGLSALFLATTGAFLELQAALNKVWGVKSQTTSSFDVRALLKRRVRSFGVVVAIGFLLMVSLTVSAAVSAITAWLGTHAAWPRVLLVVNQLLSFGVATLMFAVLYRVLPDVQLEWRHVWVGAATTSLLFAIGQRLIGLYLGSTDVASPFGAAGTIAIILVWVYYTSQVVLLGAEFTYQYATYKEPCPAPMEGAVRDPLAAT